MPTRKAETACISCSTWMFMLCAAAALCSTSAAFCCVAWSSCVTAALTCATPALCSALAVLISGRGLTERDELGRPVEDDHVLLLLNAHEESVAFVLPQSEGEHWYAMLDTTHETFEGRAYERGAVYVLAAGAVALLVKPNRRDPARTGG